MVIKGFTDSSVDKESACNAGDPGWIPGLGRSTGEWIHYPLQCSWASLVAQLIENPPAVQETWVPFLGWEYSGLENSMESRTQLSNFHFHFTSHHGHVCVNLSTKERGFLHKLFC